MALTAGTKTDDKDSLAQAVEQAFRKAWPDLIKGMDPPATTSPDLQLLFVAIAQGIVKYLKDHAKDSFKVTVTVTGGATATAEVTIETAGTLYQP